MNNVDKFFRESDYNIVRILLILSGLWPYHPIKTRSMIYFGFLLVLGSGFTFEVLGVVEVWPDTVEVIDCMTFLVFGAVSLTKLVCVTYTLPEIKILLTKIQEYQYSTKSDEETKLLHAHAVYGRNLSYAYTCIVFGHAAFILVAILFNKFYYMEFADNDDANAYDVQAGFPYRVNYMIDPETYYFPIFLHASICDVYYSILMITFDILYLTLVEHCCGLFEALRYRLENAFEYESNSGDVMSMAAKNKLYFNIVYSIRRHAEAIQFATIMESMHRIPLFVQIGANISVLSILGYQVIKNLENLKNAMRHITFLSALLLNTFFQNWLAQKVIDSSEKVYESAYNAEWYNMPVPQRKLFMMIMMRSKDPMKITAAKVIVLSYVNFNAMNLLYIIIKESCRRIALITRIVKPTRFTKKIRITCKTTAMVQRSDVCTI